MKAVVFGGAGFLGSHIADVLTEKGFDVIIYDLRKSEYLKGSQKMIVGDILDRDKIRNVLANVDYVYHFAGIAGIKDATIDPVNTIENNVLSTVYILDECKKANIKRFIYASTIYVYSSSGSFYRSSKQASELFIENYNKEFGLEYTILRFGSLYGKRANHFNFISNIIKQALVEKKITRLGDGNEIRDYINVIDAARSSVGILEDEFKNSSVMITGTQTMKVKELLNMVKEILNGDVEIEYINEESKSDEHYEITPYNFKPSVAKKLVPHYYHDLGQGILECIYDVYEELKGKNKN